MNKIITFFSKIFLKHSNSQRIIKVFNNYSNNQIKLILREDCFIEKEIELFGLYGRFEKESLKIWAKLCEVSDTIIDVGANTGIYSIIAQDMNKSSVVVAIEPISENVKVLKENIKLNKFDLKIEEVALSDEDGCGIMYMFPGKLNYMTSLGQNRYDLHPEIKGDNEVVEVNVKKLTFGTILEKYNLHKIDLIKIDVEGHEINVLYSIENYISNFLPSILIEVIGDEHANKINDFFKKFSYNIVQINEETISKKVDKITDNNHHNYLLCNSRMLELLIKQNLVII
jgi:FkbM family methyltransferase